MKKDALKILLIFILALTACQKNDGSKPSEGVDILGISDKTDEAGEMVAKANLDLKEIKAIYKGSEDVVKTLEAAMAAQDVAKVKEIAGFLVNEINKGMNLGQEAIKKIEAAEELKINDTYRDYLSLKKSSLKKQLAAFEFRRDSAVNLRDKFGGKDKLEFDAAKAALKENEDNFKVQMQTARDMSEEANRIYKESLNK